MVSTRIAILSSFGWKEGEGGGGEEKKKTFFKMEKQKGKKKRKKEEKEEEKEEKKKKTKAFIYFQSLTVHFTCFVKLHCFISATLALLLSTRMLGRLQMLHVLLFLSPGPSDEAQDAASNLLGKD